MNTAVDEREVLLEEWQNSTLLVNAHGDSEGITPRDNEIHIQRLNHVAGIFRDFMDVFTGPEDVERTGSGLRDRISLRLARAIFRLMVPKEFIDNAWVALDSLPKEVDA